MLSYKLDFSSCACKPGFVKSSHIPYTYKFLRDVNLAVFVVNLSSTKFKSSKFHKTIVIHLKHKV